MNSFVTKLIVLAIIAGGLVAFVKFTSSAKKTIDQTYETKSYYDQIAEDDARLRALPDDVAAEDKEPVQKEEPALEQTSQDTAEAAVDEVEDFVEEIIEEKQVQVVREFKKLDEIDSIEAERLFETALTDRKIGRLPVTGYKMTVDNCRMIINRYPGTEFDYKARRLLADIPERFRERYNLTDEEMDFESVGIVSEQ